MQIKKTPLFLAGLVLGLVAVGSLTYVNAVSSAGVVDIADGTTVSATDTD